MAPGAIAITGGPTGANTKANQKGIEDIDVGTPAGAWVGLKKIDSAIDQVNAARATLGAVETRFETAVNNIDIQVENLAAARGRIIDADFAVETANLEPHADPATSRHRHGGPGQPNSAKRAAAAARLRTCHDLRAKGCGMRIGMGCKAKATDIAIAMARICNAADRPRPRLHTREEM